MTGYTYRIYTLKGGPESVRRRVSMCLVAADLLCVDEIEQQY